MHRRCFINGILSIGCLTAIALAGVQTKPPDVRVLLTYGGHGFEQQPFFKLFDDLPGVDYTRAAMPASAALLKPGLEKEYDVIVMYDMAKSLSAGQRKAFTELLDAGIGIISLHHNLGAHRDWDEYPRIIGGKYLFKPRTLEGKDFAKSTYAHGQSINVRIADRKHPITADLADFQIHDETYKACYVASNAHVLLTTDHPKSNKEIAWVTTYGKSPVCYLMLGHDSKAWQHPAYPKLLLNSIRWAAEAPKDNSADIRVESDKQQPVKEE